MRRHSLQSLRPGLACLAALVLTASLAGCASAPPVPRSFEASPDIYRVMAENGRFRLIEVTWKPGQRDRMHSHPEAAGYALTNCMVRAHFRDGTTATYPFKAGTGNVQDAIAAHSIENIGTSDCKIIMFEPR